MALYTLSADLYRCCRPMLRGNQINLGTASVLFWPPVVIRHVMFDRAFATPGFTTRMRLRSDTESSGQNYGGFRTNLFASLSIA